MGTGGFLARKAGGQWPLTMRYERWAVIWDPRQELLNNEVKENISA